MTKWDEECMRWRGRVLAGKFAHYCFGYDGLPVDETCEMEWPCECAEELMRRPAQSEWDLLVGTGRDALDPMPAGLDNSEYAEAVLGHASASGYAILPQKIDALHPAFVVAVRAFDACPGEYQSALLSAINAALQAASIKPESREGEEPKP